MRLRPERSVLLFGPHTEALSEAVATWAGGATRKFKLVGNMVAPICAREVARIVDRQFKLVGNMVAPICAREVARIVDRQFSAGVVTACQGSHRGIPASSDTAIAGAASAARGRV
jgi:phage FluMu protein gp41